MRLLINETKEQEGDYAASKNDFLSLDFKRCNL